MWRLLLLAVVLCISHVSCSTPPSSLPDYDNSGGFILDYEVGDRFETLKPMFLTKPVGTWLYMAKPGIGAPSLDQYAEDSTRFDYVVKLIPVGSQLKLVAIKDAGYHTSSVYIQLPEIDEWVGVSLGEYADVGAVTHKRYNREFFKKIETVSP